MLVQQFIQIHINLLIQQCSMILYKNYTFNSILNHTRFISDGGAYTSRKKDMLLYEPRAFAINMCAVHYGANQVQNGVISYTL